MPAEAPEAPTQPVTEEPEPLGGLLAAAMSESKSTVVRSLESRADEKQPSPWRNRIAPVSLLILGIPIAYVIWGVAGSQVWPSMAAASINLAVQAVVYVPLGLLALLVTAQLMGVDFEDVRVTTFKLAAISLGALGILDGVFLHLLIMWEFDFRSMVVALMLYTAVCGVVVWFLFELDFYETLLATFIMIFPRVGIFYFATWAWHEMWL
jgi:hypothetical protein